MGNIKDYLVYFWKGTDKLLLFLCLLASSAGVLMVTSATWHTMKEGALLPRDSIALIAAVLIGLAIAMVISLIDIDIFAKSWYIWGSLGIILMVIVLLFGEAPSNRADARTWINLGFFLFQPSELVKIFFVTTFATHLDAVRDELNRVRNVALLVLHALIPFILVAISGDDGSALVFLFIAFAMLFITSRSSVSSSSWTPRSTRPPRTSRTWDSRPSVTAASSAKASLKAPTPRPARSPFPSPI